MKRLFAIAVGLGLATLAGAQQKPATPNDLLSADGKPTREPASLPVVSSDQNGRSTTLVLDISGEQSWDGLFDTSNTILKVQLGTGQVMTGIGWDVTIATVGASWLSEARVYFDGSDRDAYGLFLTPGVTDGFPGTGTYSSGGIIDLTDNGIPDIPILADGDLWIELFEGYDDVGDAVDADWLSTSTLTIVYEDAPVPHDCPLWLEDFDSGTWPPAGWSVVDNTGSGSWNTSSFFSRGNVVPGGTGESASIDSDWYGIGPLIDGELWTGPFDLDGPALLEYDMNYQNFAGIDFADVDISTDGGANWTNVVQYNSDLTGHFIADLTPWAGTTGVMLRFHYYIGDYFWYWQLDNVGLYALAAATHRNAGSNPDVYTIAGPPAVGGNLDVTIDTGPSGHNNAELYGFTTPTTTLLGGGQTLLVNSADPYGELLGLDPMPGPTVNYSIPVPTDCAFAGFSFSTQALLYGGTTPFALSNAYDLVIGY